MSRFKRLLSFDFSVVILVVEVLVCRTPELSSDSTKCLGAPLETTVLILPETWPGLWLMGIAGTLPDEMGRVLPPSS